MHQLISTPGDPPFPGFPPEVPPMHPPAPLPNQPAPPVPLVPVPPPTDAGGDLRSRVYEELLRRRTVLLDRLLDHEAASLVAAQLMALDVENTKPITLVVNSPGGPLEAAGALLDTIELVRSSIDTTCLGHAEGTAAVIVACGTGHRRVGPTAQIRLRLPDVELSGTATDLEEKAAHLRRLYDTLIERLATATGQSRQLVARDVQRGRFLSGEEAVEYGLADEVVSHARP